MAKCLKIGAITFTGGTPPIVGFEQKEHYDVLTNKYDAYPQPYIYAGSIKVYLQTLESFNVMFSWVETKK